MIKLNVNFQSLNYYPWEGWGRHRDLILSRFEFNKRSPYQLVLANPYKMESKPIEKVIFMSTYEADKVPESWIEPANASIGLIVPAKWVKSVVSSSGITSPVFVVPEGITDNTIFDPVGSKFTFLHFDATSYANRKGGDLVVNAFIELFGNMQDKVKLVMKGRHHSIPFFRDYPSVEYIFENYTDQQMKYLFSQTNCFVFPSRGEGFGLPPLEAMAHGIPTILTNGSAMQEFAKLGIPVRVEKKIPSDYGKVIAGNWNLPDIKHLKELMWNVYVNYETEKERAVENAKIVWERYNFDTVAKELAKTVNKIIENNKKRSLGHSNAPKTANGTQNT